MHTFVTDIEESHPANPKPLYKTHKKDEHGEMIKPVPIRNLTTACGTPVANLSKLSQCNISQLTTKDHLPLRNSSTNQVLRKIIVINEEHGPLDDEALMVFPDIKDMYPNVDTDEAVEIIGDKYENNPSKHGLPKDCVVEALKICKECNCVQFNEILAQIKF